jgi:hypothetical protein
MAHMHEPKIDCPIWGTPALILATVGDGAKLRSLRTGGDYQISGTAAATVQHKSAAEKTRITTWIVDQRRAGEIAPFVTDDVVQKAAARKPLRISEKKRRFFLLLISRELRPSQLIRVAGRDDDELKRNLGEIASWTECSDLNDVGGLIGLLVEEGLVAREGLDFIKLTAKGFDRMEALESGAAPSRQAFVAMWFHPSMDDAFNIGIEPAIREAGYDARRIDQKEHINKVDDEIVAEIRRSRFIVADFTSGTTIIDGKKVAIARGGVYFEAGFARGLNIPVIWTCQEDMIDLVHFDTRQFGHITWKDPADLKTKLLNRIRAVIV